MARDLDTINDIRFARAPSGFVIGFYQDKIPYEVTIAELDGAALRIRATAGADPLEEDLTGPEIYAAFRQAIERKVQAKADAAEAAAILEAEGAE